ncbi:MAG TPA: ribonuclease P protein component [Burkholderiales bacterium]|nr:ribonuclease P protein component [Burkholderiales bacterium]
MPERGKRTGFGFGPDRRLSRRGEFERLLTQGKRRNLAGYTFFLEKREEGPPRLGILISRKHSARATERNGIKRCIREAFRLEQARLEGFDMLIRPPYGARASAEMLSRVRELLCKVAA